MAAQITAVIYFPGYVCIHYHGKNSTAHCDNTLQCCNAHSRVWCLYAQFHCVIRDTELQSFTSVDFWRAGAEATESTKGINWQTIIFIFGMMIMVEGMAISGFFSWLCLTIAKTVRYNTTKIFVMFMVLAFVLSMFIDSITVISVSGRNHHHTRQTVEI